jgi:hypothetical protein
MRKTQSELSKVNKYVVTEIARNRLGDQQEGLLEDAVNRVNRLSLRPYEVEGEDGTVTSKNYYLRPENNPLFAPLYQGLSGEGAGSVEMQKAMADLQYKRVQIEKLLQDLRIDKEKHQTEKEEIVKEDLKWMNEQQLEWAKFQLDVNKANQALQAAEAAAQQEAKYEALTKAEDMYMEIVGPVYRNLWVIAQQGWDNKEGYKAANAYINEMRRFAPFREAEEGLTKVFEAYGALPQDVDPELKQFLFFNRFFSSGKEAEGLPFEMNTFAGGSQEGEGQQGITETEDDKELLDEAQGVR